MEYTVKNLIIYPVKGMAGISLPSAVCEERGFQYDRRYLVVDENGKFCSQREYPKLALLKTSINNNELTISYLDESFITSWGNHTQFLMEVKVWDHEFKSYKVSEEASLWISRVLGSTCDLVYMDKDNIRTKTISKPPHSVSLSFADGYPYLIIGTASFEYLNNQLSTSINTNRFRANIIVQTSEPHEEDKWEDIKIGHGDFKVIKPCARCNVITIDQQSGVRSKEPLITLSKYRKEGNKVNFGANTICMETGVTINIGDKVKL
jgi:uncharacterized protein YcbX